MSKQIPATLDNPNGIERAHAAIREMLDSIDDLGVNSVNSNVNVPQDVAAIKINKAYRAVQDMRDALNEFGVIYG